MQVRDDDEADGESHLHPQHDLERRAGLPVARSEGDAGQRRDEQRSVPEWTPTEPELPHRAGARGLFERAHGGDADEDQRRRAADPDGGGQQMHGHEDTLQPGTG